jgi:methionyl-tRNA synthetase
VDAGRGDRRLPDRQRAVEEARGPLRGGARALQARVLATAAEAIRIITALVYPILPDSAAKVWRQLGQGEIADAAKNHF